MLCCVQIQATLGLGSSSAERCILQCHVGHKSPIFLCSLLPDKNETCPLSLEFQSDDLVAFSVIGPRSIHLSGYFVANEGDGVLDDYDSYPFDLLSWNWFKWKFYYFAVFIAILFFDLPWFIFPLLLCEVILLGRILLTQTQTNHLSLILKTDMRMRMISLMIVILTCTTLHMFQIVEVGWHFGRLLTSKLHFSSSCYLSGLHPV